MNSQIYDNIVKECKKIVMSRNKKYGNSTAPIDIHTIVGIVIMKLTRIYKLGTENAKTLDELQDSINYIVFALDKFKQEELK